MPEFDEQLEQPHEGNAELSNHGDLSDDELLEQFEQVASATYQVEAEQEDPEQTPEDEVTDPELEAPEQAEEANVPDDEDEGSAVEEGATDQEPKVPELGQQASEPEVVASDAPDYKTFYEQVTAQFKANGRELQVTSPTDIIALMQQGANYDKKMSSLKPAMQVHRTLEKEGLLDPAKIGFLIDLHNGKPEAIAKLIADHEIDTYSLEGKSEEYVPQARMASEREVEISAIIQELDSVPTFKETFDRLGAWDEQSQKQILDNPRMLRMFQEHKDAGIFDQIHNAIEHERMFGRLVGVTDFEAYRLVGDQLFANGQTQVQAQPLAQRPVVQPQEVPVVPPTPKSDPRVEAKKAQLNQKRSAASAPRKVAQGHAQEQFNPLAISDEDLMAIADRSTRLM